MSIIENSFLHLTTILIFIFGLGSLILSYLKKNYQFANWGFGILFLGFLQTLFIVFLQSDWFVLSHNVDYAVNLSFSFSCLILGIVSITGLLFYYRHRIIPAIFIQLGILFSSVLIVITFSTSVSQSLSKRSRANSDTIKFLKAEDFSKGSQNPKLSKAGSPQDSVMSR